MKRLTVNAEIIPAYAGINIIRSKQNEKEQKNKHDLNVLTVEEVKLAYECQKKNNDWTFYHEREFVENLLQTRFHFLITVYTLFLLPFFNAKYEESKIVILIIGLIIVGIIGLAVYRIYVKFDVIMKILYKFDGYHVLLMQGKETRARKI